MTNTADRPWRFWLLALLWLPAGLILQAAVRFGGVAEPLTWSSLLMAAGSLVPVAPCGLPLALACRWLWRLGHRRAAWGWGIGLGIVTVFVALLAGLFGPVAIILCALVLSAPVWIAALVSAKRSRQATPGA